MNDELIEQLLEKNNFVVDLLPKQVPSDSKGEFFAVERFFLTEPQLSEMRKRFMNIILKLFCYFPMKVRDLTSGNDICSPEPEDIAALVYSDPHDILILIEETLITLNKDDICMTMYSPSESILTLTKQLAYAEGMFLWEP